MNSEDSRPQPAAAKAQGAPYVEASEAQRAELLQRLERQREQIDAVLSPGGHAAASSREVARPDGFPRSHTMRLILSEPMLMAALSTLATRVFGARLMRALPLAATVARSVHAALRPEARPRAD